MSSGALKSISRLLDVLSDDEHAILRMYLRSFHKRGEKAVTKAMRLYEILMSKDAGRTLNENEAMYAIYGEMGVVAFDRLILRLRDKILETLLLDVNVKREDAYSERARAIIEVRKRLLCAQILIERGDHELAVFLFSAVAEKARLFEIYDDLQAALLHLYKIQSLVKGIKFAQKYLDEYKHSEYCRHAVAEAEISYHNLIVRDDYSTKGETGIQELEATIEELAKYYEASNSAVVGYYYYYLKAHLYEIIDDYPRVRKALYEILHLLEKRQSIYTETRKGLVLASIAENALYSFQFEQALNNGRESLKYLKTGSFNYQHAKEVIILSLFYSGEYEKALDNINSVLAQDIETIGEFRKGKYDYFKACTLFMLKRYEQAGQILAVINPIENDTEGWNIGIRILTIMNTLEVLQDDEASGRIHNLNMHLRTISKDKGKQGRARLIYEILRDIVKYHFDYRQVFENAKLVIENLDRADGNNAWKIRSSELVIFHLWFVAKATSTPFVQKFPVQASAKSSVRILGAMWNENYPV
ncbi:MAG: hypothetical protein FD123_2051 [Bacteroidetes bacterium]|nr:MAG: hypothetical protein FD123_2051 [Bacteroidota bacterium]